MRSTEITDAIIVDESPYRAKIERILEDAGAVFLIYGHNEAGITLCCNIDGKRRQFVQEMPKKTEMFAARNGYRHPREVVQKNYRTAVNACWRTLYYFVKLEFEYAKKTKDKLIKKETTNVG